MDTTTNPGIRRGRELGQQMYDILSDALDRAEDLATHEPDDTARAAALTTALTLIGVYTNGRYDVMRRTALRRMRFPDDNLTGPPARGWREIATAVGLTPTRAQQLSELPGDRTAPRAPGAGRKPRDT